MALNARHVRALGEAVEALGRARAGVEAGAEVVAMELREALDALGSVLGRMSPDDLLGRIFSQFCIGK
jgi:tRNA modification GTPase